MPIVEVDIIEESQSRYLTYALSVVSSRALPDVRDGLKPVQRRILYAMVSQLNLTPDKYHRKSAAVVGEVLARFHPHGDSACYDAMVRMAQDFSLRYPLVDGQGNFGSLDGDAAAAYRYTEARVTQLAMEVVGEIGQNTVSERDNFDQTIKEPVVLPSRIPNLLINGAAGIAVGMACAIPPHNLREVIKALLILLEDDQAHDSKIFSAIKGPDFPTGCLILNSPAEIKEIYRSGRGAVRMRGAYKLEKTKKGKEQIIITSVPYGIDKSALIKKIADFIIAKKLPQLVDVRDESTDEVNIVLEPAPGADPEKAMAFLFKNTSLQQNFNVNLTALVPTANPHICRPAQLSLREMLQHFIGFRLEVTKSKLLFEKSKLDERIHLLQGIVKIFPMLDEVIKIVRKSDGRADSAKKLQERFKLSEKQSLYIVDLRIYQLSKTSIDEIEAELNEKSKRVSQIEKIVKSEKALKGEISIDLTRIVEQYGDARRSEIVAEFEEIELDKEEYVQHEEVYVIVSKDGWLKRIRSNNDPENTRLREGDKLAYSAKADTRDTLFVFSNQGSVYSLPVFDLSATSGFGEPVQKILKFGDGEQIVSCLVLSKQELENIEKQQKEILLYTKQGMGFRLGLEQIVGTKKGGKRIMKVAADDALSGIEIVNNSMLFFLTEQGYAVCMMATDVPQLNASAKGVIIQKVPKDDALVLAAAVDKKSNVNVDVGQSSPKEIKISSLTIGGRAKRGERILKRLTVIGRAKIDEIIAAPGGASQGELFKK